MDNQKTLTRLKAASCYLEGLVGEGFSIIDLNMIEPFSSQDKKYQPTSVIFEKDDTLLAIRSDWTRSILNYKKLYNNKENKIAYFGPVIRNKKTTYQTGAEIYQADLDQVLETISWHLDFVVRMSGKNLTTMTVNNESLLDLYLNGLNESELIRNLIYSKDISTIKDICGSDSKIYQLMVEPVSGQFQLIKNDYPNEEPVLSLIQLEEELASYGLKFIVDLSFRSPQEYYNGFYFQVFLDQNKAILSGGAYGDNAFGIALDLSEGGLI